MTAVERLARSWRRFRAVAAGCAVVDVVVAVWGFATERYVVVAVVAANAVVMTVLVAHAGRRHDELVGSFLPAHSTRRWLS